MPSFLVHRYMTGRAGVCVCVCVRACVHALVGAIVHSNCTLDCTQHCVLGSIQMVSMEMSNSKL